MATAVSDQEMVAILAEMADSTEIE